MQLQKISTRGLLLLKRKGLRGRNETCRSCRTPVEAGVARRRNTTQAEGAKLAKACEDARLGTMVAWQSRLVTGDGATQDYMIGELVDGGKGHRCVVEQVKERSKIVPGSTAEGNTRFSRNDYVTTTFCDENKAPCFQRNRPSEK